MIVFCASFSSSSAKRVIEILQAILTIQKMTENTIDPE